jgi:signal transduction histidine kinase
MEMALRIAWNDIKYVAEVEKSYGALPPVNGIAPQLNQVFVNLLVNATQAISQKGGATPGKISIRTSASNGIVRVEISDTGVGISEENLSRIFDPFFTTKKVGQGTGLGLSVSYGIVQRMGGQIRVRSRVGQGTTFYITLPAARAEKAQGKAAPSPKRSATLLGRVKPQKTGPL